MRRAVAVAVLLLVAGAARAGDYEKLSCFTNVRFTADGPSVEFEGEWFRPVSIAGKPVAEILGFARGRWPGKWRKRFAEDLVEVLSEMGAPPGRAVDLVLVRVSDGEQVERKGAPMTEENRRRVWRAAVDRERADRDPPARLTQKDALADLAELRGLLEDRFSYLTLKGVGLDPAFAAAESGLGPVVARADLALRIQKLLARFGDGHTGVREAFLSAAPGRLPFLVAEAEGRFVAFRPDRSGFLDDDHPYLTAIDGRDVGEWVADAGAVVAQGSPQFSRRASVRMLRYLPWLRKVAGKQADGPVAATLVSQSGRSTRTVRIALSPRRPIYGDWPRADSRILDGDIGYLRIDDMDDDEEFLAGLRAAMGEFRETKGLVIDVRGNGGGTRDALRTLLPYLLDPKGPPRVVNVARFRIPPGEERGRKDGYLENRGLYPVTASVWSKEEAAAIRKFAKRFRPAWTPPKDAFSALHYMLVRPGGEGVYHYDRPVVVLQDAGCFSATDIFLGAMKGVPGVTLLGTTSGGGSGRSRPWRLARTRIRVRISSMASWRPTGELYDGLGVPPDVTVTPLATDLIGKTDRMLAEALSRLR